MMDKEVLFAAHQINESHGKWDDILDNWNSVEIFRIMHSGKLPISEDESIDFVVLFLKKSKHDLAWWAKNVMRRPDWGSLFLTAKRIVYKHYNSK